MPAFRTFQYNFQYLLLGTHFCFWWSVISVESKKLHRICYCSDVEEMDVRDQHASCFWTLRCMKLIYCHNCNHSHYKMMTLHHDVCPGYVLNFSLFLFLVIVFILSSLSFIFIIIIVIQVLVLMLWAVWTAWPRIWERLKVLISSDVN